jgi:hypothetical protein
VLAFDREAVPLGEVLDRRVEVLRALHREGDPVAAAVLRGTDGQGSAGEAPGSELTLEEARLAIARDHGYTDWDAARGHADLTVDTRFEAAADAIQWGELAALRDLIDAHPPLISARSPFPHHCMLLHHVAANGIEVERQLQSPPNATDIMRLLLDRGAEPDAACDLYGGGPNMTTMCLLVSSCVPAAAGVQAALVEELCRGGATPDGPGDDGAPLRTAIMSGYIEAARVLVRRGARVDNLVFRKDPDLSYAEPFFGSTARGAARYNGHTEIVALIEERLAS